MKKNQEIIDVDLPVGVFKGADGKINGSIGVIKDITDIKRARERGQGIEQVSQVP